MHAPCMCAHGARMHGRASVGEQRVRAKSRRACVQRARARSLQHERTERESEQIRVEGEAVRACMRASRQKRIFSSVSKCLHMRVRVRVPVCACASWVVLVYPMPSFTFLRSL
eukprot:4411514-Pleurochrysis_carterae.AAC.1